MDNLTKTQQFVLEWLSKEDFSPLGACRGADLDALVAAGLAQIGPSIPGRDDGYRAVSLTEKGWMVLKDHAE